MKIGNITTISLSKEIKERLIKFWKEQDPEQTMENFDMLISGMMDYIEENEKNK